MVRRLIAALGASVVVLATCDALAAESRTRAEDSSLYLETDRDAEKLLEAARAAVRAGNWRQAVEAYQRVADFAGRAGAQPLVAAEAGATIYLPIQDAAAQELARLPRPALDLYREGHDAAAKAVFDRALAARDAALLGSVAQRYLATSWGDDALATLGSLAFERADYTGALMAWTRLLETCPEPTVPLPPILARMWVCCRALGQDGPAQAITERLRTRHADATLRAGGEEVSVARFLAQEVRPVASAPLSDWPALGGDATHARLMRGFAEVGGPAWRFPLPYAAVRPSHREGDLSPYPIPLPIHATVVGDTVFLADHSAVYALSIETGQPIWLFPDAPEAGPPAALDETVHAVACADGRAFARLAHTLLAFDAATGQVLWRRSFAEEKPEALPEEKPEPEPKADDEPEEPPKKKGRAKTGKLLGTKVRVLLTPPVVAGPRVFVGFTHLGEEARTSVVALDAATGQEAWRTFVCSRSIPAFLGLGASASPPAVAGNTVYLATNLGTVAAVDAQTGAIRWVHRYPSFPSHLRRSIVERNERWTNSPLIVDGGLVFVAPQDASSLLALDAVRGALAWSAPRDGCRYLVGVEGRGIFSAGAHVVATGKATGKRLWSTELPERAAGRPALCQGRLYVPTERALHTVLTADGASTVCRVWQPFEEPGNLTVVDRALFLASRDRIYAFSNWAATEAGLARRRQADAADPVVPLTIGLHEAARGAHAAALPHLEEALRLAGARKDEDALRRARQAVFDTCRSLGEAGDATALAKALAHAPEPADSVAVLLALARLHERQGRAAEAIAACHRILGEHAGATGRTEQGLRVSAGALASAEIGRILRELGRAPYEAVEAEAARRLAAARADAELESIVRRFPHSAAAERAMLRLLAAPNARAMAPHLSALAHAMAADPASEARAAVEAKLKALADAARAHATAMTPRWQVQTRIAHQRIQVVPLPGAPPGRLYLATARRSFERAMPFDSIECRQADTGQLVWQRELSEWDTLGVVAGGQLLVATFDEVLALDPLSGATRWRVSLAEPVAVEKLEPEDPAPPPRRRPGARLGEPGEGPWRPWERRRTERRRIVALAAGPQAVYAGLMGGEVAALGLADGAKLWSRQLDARVLLARALFVHDGRVWACAESPGAAYALSEKDGTGNDTVVFQRDAAAFRVPRITDRPAFVPVLGRLYVVVDDHTVHALDLRQGRSLWEAYLESSINRILASDDGEFCYAIPDVFLHDAQIVSLHPDTGKVRRRRSVLGGSLTDAVLGPGALYVAERDNDNALVIQALDAVDLSERWRTAPLQLAQPTGIALADGLLAVAGRHAGQRAAVLIATANGRLLGDAEPRGANELSAALAGDLLVLGSDRGIFAYGPSDAEGLDQRVAALSARARQGDRSALAPLAVALYQRGDEKRAIALLAQALSDEALPAADYATLKDLLNSLRESLASREPATLETAQMLVPPNIDGAIDEPWRADLAARLNGPAYIDEVQGIPIPEARWRSPSDLSAVLYTGWDAKHFYFALDVSDDVHRTYTGQSDTWVGDGLIISVDCENDGGYGYRFTGKDLLLTLALTRKDERRDDDEGDDEPSGEYRVRLKDDNSGAIYEVAVPWDYLGIENPGPGLRFGFNITVTDDDGDRAVKAISWTPGMILDRDRMLMIRGFTPALFGDVLLTGQQAGPAPLWTPPPPARDDPLRVYRIRPSKEK
ncbi:MAG TPA: PQQ-binding-like beta-propeller repeat protein [Planctomycetota bacterium]|nr:PQQ-binding-like beta-propeller repeat protein [Planctomycetota bacterium]